MMLTNLSTKSHFLSQLSNELWVVFQKGKPQEVGLLKKSKITNTI